MKEDRPFPEPVRRPTALKAAPASSPPGPARALLDRLRERIRSRHYSPHTERAYVAWVSRYVLFHRRRDPAAMAEREVGEFLSHLASRQHVAASTQNQALSALLFLYDSVLGRPLARLAGVVRARRPKRLPQVLSREEVRRVLAHLHGTSWLMASLMYGSGLRLMECARLRIMDIDFGQQQIVVRDGKGQKDRVTLLPSALARPLRSHLERLDQLHQREVAAGRGWAEVPAELERTQSGAARLRAWQWVFPARSLRLDRRWDRWRRPHQHPSAVQRAFREAVIRAGLDKPATCHTLRHCFATHLLESGQDLRTIQELMGHKDVTTTLIYARVRPARLRAIRSPADDLE